MNTGLPALERLSEARASLGANPWSPTGRELIFSRETDAGGVALWKIDRISREEAQITFPEAEERHLAASWTFDGSRIAYERRKDGRMELWVSGPDGSGAKRIAGERARSFMPVWSADGTRVVFVSARLGGMSLWEVEVETGRERRLSTGSWDYLPNVSQDGRLVFNALSHQQDLIWLELATGQERRLTDHTHENLFPRLSPDGSRVVYQANRTGNDEIWALDLATGAERRLTHHPSRDMAPDWSPDGERIVFLSERQGATEVWIMNSDGSAQRALPGPPTSAGFEWEAGAAAPRWSPDGLAVGYLAPAARASVLWVVDLESNRVRSHLKHALYFDWFLDSRRVIYTARSDDTGLAEVRTAHLATGREAVLLRGPAIEVDASGPGDKLVYANAESHFEMNLFELPLRRPDSADGLPSAAGEGRQLTDGRGRWHVHGAGLSEAGDAVVFTRDADDGDIFVVEGYQ